MQSKCHNLSRNSLFINRMVITRDRDRDLRGVVGGEWKCDKSQDVSSKEKFFLIKIILT